MVYNRRIIKYNPKKDKTPEETYMAENIEQYYDWINPDMGKTE